MRKSSIFFMGALLSFTFAFCSNNVIFTSANSATMVYVGGMSAGFTLQSGSPQIVGICEVMSENGVSSPALNAGLKTGDRILKVNEIKVETIAQLNEIVNKSKGKELKLTVERGGEEFIVNVTPIKNKINGEYKIGILARDQLSGIGTVTYLDKKNNRFGSLGHSVEGENKKQLTVAQGTVYACSIVGVNKGMRGKAGELRGMFLNDQTLGKAEKLCDCGIFGEISSSFSYEGLEYVVADSTGVMPGDAYIYSTVDGVSPKRYEIEIVKVEKKCKDNKNYVIKITDNDLIDQTGGIVQGMSGSPILQNGKLVGAVTHVFLNDPTRGYGIDIQTMLRE